MDLESFLEMLITKESLKTSFTIEQLLTHKFFGEFATQKSIDAIHESLKKEISIAEISGKNSIHNAIQKFETRLKDEQKLVCRAYTYQCFYEFTELYYLIYEYFLK